jgi:type I restriction enzyme, R subunit
VNEYSEDALVEQPTLILFRELGWETGNCYGEKVGDAESTLGRRTLQEVVLLPRLRAALEQLNPSLPGSAIDDAIDELTRSRSALGPVVANR